MNLPLFHPLLMSLVTLILPKKFRTYLLLGMLDRVMLATSSSHAESSYLMGTAKCMRVRRTSRTYLLMSLGMVKSIPSIVDEFCNIDIAKEVKDLLVTRYARPSDARNFKLTREE